VTNSVLKAYTLSKSKALVVQKVAQQSVQRAPDAGDSGAIPSLFLRLSIFPVGRRSAALCWLLPHPPNFWDFKEKFPSGASPFPSRVGSFIF